MAKVFRIHRNEKNTIKDWNKSSIINSGLIATIVDTEAATDKKEITSIPSPFARIDLVKRAFQYVNNNGLEGKTTYHKLVSDALDVGQIFFNIEKYRDNDTIEIVVWDKTKHLSELQESKCDEHKILGRTYATYLDQDGAEYNFNKMDSIYLLNYISGPKEDNFIGATSPATLFFSPANNLSYVNDKIMFGDDKPFDDDYKPLYKRESEYIKYWYSLRYGLPNFSSDYPEVADYLTKCFEKIDDDLKKFIHNNIKDKSEYYESSYDDILVSRQEQNHVKLLGSFLKTRKPVSDIDSGFKMKIPDEYKRAGVKIPLLLPCEETDTFSSVKYVTSNWSKNIKAPKSDNRSIQDRTLPYDGTKYPYVTILDFLEKDIVQIPYQINKKRFFDGNIDKNGNSYLLPITPTFFNYFPASFLSSTIKGKKVFEIEDKGGWVNVTLRIPIVSGHCIEYTRSYHVKSDETETENVHTGCGNIIQYKFTIAHYPLLKYPDYLGESFEPFYRVALLDRETVSREDSNCKLRFYKKEIKEGNEIGVREVNPIEVLRNRNSDKRRIDREKIDSKTYCINEQYDYIQVEIVGEKCGIVIPIFEDNSGEKVFKFAIDLGTTNTHIEYSVDNFASKPFDIISQSEQQIHRLHITDDAEYDIINSDLIPENIGPDKAYHYPMRTVLSECLNTNWRRPVYSMAHVNIPFTYEKAKELDYNKLTTELKWSTGEKNDKLEKYIECLLIMLRNKVLLNQGNLKETKVVWFYPLSMTRYKVEEFKEIWKRNFVQIFSPSDENNIIEISESSAPYYFYKNRRGADSTTVSIDIGGGTTDVYISNGISEGSDSKKNHASFRYAANSVFGDGYGYDSDSNEIVKKYKKKIAEILDKNNKSYLTDFFKILDQSKKSSDYIAFFFSLATNKDLEKPIKFINMLSEDRSCKYIVLIFYSSIIYHIAKIMKAKGYDMPRHISFSGNGSNILRVLTGSKEILQDFTKIIFRKVYSKDSYSEDGLEIIQPECSKESTCKGAFLLPKFEPEKYGNLGDSKAILLGVDDNTFIDKSLTYDKIDNQIREKIINSVKEFIDFIFDLDEEFSYNNNFSLDRGIFEGVKGLCMRDLDKFLRKGIEDKINSIKKEGGDMNIEETLFFYPIGGILNTLNREIYKLR